MSRSPLLLCPLALALLLSLLHAERADACGPDFPPTLLDERKAVLTDLPDAPFVIDVRQLLDGLRDPDPRVVPVFGEPEGVRQRGGERERALYDEGARAFHARDEFKMRRGQDAFRALLALPAEERRHRSTWAAFMLGRMGHPELWAETRKLAAAGFHDELGLAAASFGEEARAHLYPAVGASVDVVAAVTLYARQARAGDDSGGTSLLQVVREVVDDADEGRLRQLEGSAVGQRLLASYAWARGDERPECMRAIAVRLAGVTAVQWPDRLAAALYRFGAFDDARRVLRTAEQTPLSLWVQAKLALQAGDVDGARALLAAASRAFPPVVKKPPVGNHDDGGVVDGRWHPLAPTPRARVLGEEAVLHLSRREYVLALHKLLQAEGFWQDAAHVAERVLTVDELRAFVVDQHIAFQPGISEEWAWGDPRSQHNQLRSLLARRLLREGRPAEALPFFDDPALRLHVDAYLLALRGSVDDDDELLRAEALYALAQLTRSHGMELRGTELGPDWRIWGGHFDPTGWDDDDDKDPSVPTPSPLVDVDEAQRAHAARPSPDERWHYRRVAMHLAEDAAGHVPPRSQAYAALLCQASRYAKRSPDDVARLWSLYVERGAAVDFTGAFGSFEIECPAPDFQAVREGRRANERAAVVDAAAPLAVPLAVVAVVVLWLRRRRSAGRAPAFHAPP